MDISSAVSALGCFRLVVDEDRNPMKGAGIMQGMARSTHGEVGGKKTT